MYKNSKKKISILWKVTLWYTVFLAMLSLILVAVIYRVSGRIIRSNSQETLIHLVQNALDEVEYDDGELEVDDDFESYRQNVSLVVYDKTGTVLAGRLPTQFPQQQPVIPDEMNTISYENESWYMYESEKELPGYGKIRIQGIMQTDAVTGNQHIVVYVLLAFFPLLILIAAVGGFLITRKAFLPIVQMRKAVEQINSGKDLTRRVDLGDGTDEIYRLGHTFDQMFERLEESFEREKQFTSDVSHELRTPVSVILSQCEYALEHNPSQEVKQALTAIYRQTGKMHRMIQQLLMLSRCDQGFEKLQIENINFSELSEIVIEDIEEKAKKKKISIEKDIQSGILVQGDETLLMRMLMNLMNNAIKYGRDDGTMKVVIRSNGSTVTGIIQDDGIGIAKEEQEKIWNRFYQVNTARSSDHEESIGLGLSMVKWIVEAHGGSIHVESELGVGSSFQFQIPINHGA